MNLSKNEREVLEVLWDHSHLADDKGEISAKVLSDLVTEKYGWPKTSNYSYFNRLVTKGALRRGSPGYTLKALVTKDEIELYRANKLIQDLFDGSFVNFFSAFLSRKEIKAEELDEIKKAIQEYQKK